MLTYRTRLTYNCAHLRSTKECLTLGYLEKENRSIAEKGEGGKYLKGEIVILQRRRKTGEEGGNLGGKYILVPVRIEAVLVDT